MILQISFLNYIQGDEAKGGRVRTNYKLRVGNKPIGRYTPYSQVRTPPSGKYPSEEGARYYRHPRVSKMLSFNKISNKLPWVDAKTIRVGTHPINCTKSFNPHFLLFSREHVLPKPHILTMNMYLAIRLLLFALLEESQGQTLFGSKMEKSCMSTIICM